uniref:Uncharacterized protein n=1 Tax=Solanum tuberosum TaxID=4113 RepID=M1B6W9_SOLTU
MIVTITYTTTRKACATKGSKYFLAWTGKPIQRSITRPFRTSESCESPSESSLCQRTDQTCI